MMLYQSGRGIDPGKIYVRLNPGDNGEFAVIELAGTDGAALFINSAAEADALIAAVVEAKQLLAPPVITCSERTCDAKHPETGDWCVIEGEHAEHADYYGATWPAGQGGVLFNVGDEDEPCSPDAAEMLYDAIVAGTPVQVSQ